MMKMMMKTMTEDKVTSVTVNGVFGELLQGVRTDGEPFLVTNPVDIYANAIFYPDSLLDRIYIKTSGKHKAQALADKIYQHFHLPHGGTIEICTQFPIGKGLGSSSADLVAVARSLNKFYNLSFTPRDIENFLRGIEPTDGVMYPGIVSFYYRKVALDKSLGKIRGGKIIGVDQGGEVDTVQYNQIKRDYSTQEKACYDELFRALKSAIANNDIFSIGQITTQSAELNQRFHEKIYLEEFLKFSRTLELPGVICAHSGTYLGFLLDTRHPNFESQDREVKQMIQKLRLSYTEFFTI